MNRSAALMLARSAGYHRDAMALVRLVVESRVRGQLLREEYAAGERAYWSGVPCSCWRCSPGSGNSGARLRPVAPGGGIVGA